jgi:Tfp pilus assembly protein PilV
MNGLRQRLRAEEGFGLVELMISLVVLNVGILAIVAGFNAGALALLRATETSTASTLADKQLELYRAITYPAISLSTTAVDATYTGDVAYPGTRVTGACTSPVADSCVPTRTVTAAQSPDGRPYRIDTFIIRYTPTANGREIKRVTVVVRRPSPLKVLARLNSNFDQSTG